MIDTRLILIDGITGVGKSTTAQRLWLHLRRQGRAARWFYEHDTTHPIWAPDELDGLAAAGVLPPGFMAETLPRRWRALAAECAATDTVTILESSFLQTGIGALLAMNVAPSAIRDHLAAVERAMVPARPVLVYLRRADLSRALAEVCENRRAGDYAAQLIAYLGATPYGRTKGITDFAGVRDFYEHWAALVETVWERLTIRKLAIDCSAGDWPAREACLTDVLGLPRIQEWPVQIERPSRFRGCYRDPDSGDELVVAGDAQGLHLGDERKIRLLPESETRFYVESVCATMTFADELDGLFQRFEFQGNLPGLSPVWVRTAENAAGPTPGGAVHGAAARAHRHD